MSWLGLFNRIVLQWFFIRLTKCSEKRIEEFNLQSYDLMPDGNISSRGTGKVNNYQWYSIMYWVVPFSGWDSNFKYINDEQKLKKYQKKN
jgi:hypothetical protein